MHVMIAFSIKKRPFDVMTGLMDWGGGDEHPDEEAARRRGNVASEDQEELAAYAREIRGRRTGVYRLSDDERAGIERGPADMRAGLFATGEQIAAIFKKARSFRA
jgi:hypothetical protein